MEALREAGRPLTAGEVIHMHLRGVSKPTATVARATLEAMADTKMIVRRKIWDEHLRRDLDGYAVATRGK